MSESRTKRSGIQALYSFTPFKLLFGKNEYGLILVPIVYNKTYDDKGKIINDMKWNRGIADEFPVPYYKRDFKVMLPREIKPYIFVDKNPKKSIVYKNKNLLNSNYRINKLDASKPFPLLIKYSYDSLRYGYYCKYGLVLLHSKKTCPLSHLCKLYERGNNGDCKYYDGPKPYERLYNVFPHIVRRVRREEGIGNRKEVSALIVVDLGKTERILGKIEFSDKLTVTAFSDASIFRAKAADLMYKDFLWVSYKEGIGFRLNNLNGLIIEFNEDALKDYISWIINNNQAIREWLCIKMLIYFGLEPNKNIILKKFSFSGKGFDAMDRFENIIDKIINNNFKLSCKDDNLTLFGSFVLIHTLAHVIINNIISALVTPNILSDYMYYINHSIFGDTSASIYIVETIYGGFGYLKTINDMIISGDKTLSSILSNLLNNYNNHEKVSNRSLYNLNQLIGSFKGRLDQGILDRVLDIFNSWRNNISSNSFPSHFAVRNYLGNRFKKNINANGDTRQAFKDLIAELPLCWDGCNLCVGMDKGCMFGPYDQPFLISRNLVTEFLATFNKWFGKKDFSITNNLYLIFKDLINLARNEIKIVSPWISKEIIDDLKTVKEEKERDLNITIICLNDSSNAEAIEEAEKSGIHIIKVPSSKESKEGKIHSKFMIIDNSIALMGSANFTVSGLKNNVEADMVTIDPDKIEKLLQQFDEISKNYGRHE
ncbi:phospholipase D-like domain-containing protein [Acidianus infernus]|nr:phospholipase D-like domain-containing protein [Acidianus infernus]